MKDAIRDQVHRLRDADSEAEICQVGAGLVAAAAGSPATVYRLDGDGRLIARSTTRESLDPDDRSFVLSDRILAETAQLERTVRIEDCADTRSAGAVDAEADTCRSALLSPIPGWGLLVATDGAPGAFDDHDEVVAGLVAELLAARLSNSATAVGPSGADERLDRIASILSHDLGNPLTIARAYVQHVMETGETERLADVELALDRIEEITGGLETFARTGRTVEEPEPVALEEAIEVGWSIVETERATLEADETGTIVADAARLYQLFENLFSNAVQHGGESATVRVGMLQDGTGFFVEDDGPGISAERREVVFDHGYSGTEDQSGFGLSIVRAIVEAHGWEIRVVEGADGGARFEVSGVRTA